MEQIITLDEMYNIHATQETTLYGKIILKGNLGNIYNFLKYLLRDENGKIIQPKRKYGKKDSEGCQNTMYSFKLPSKNSNIYLHKLPFYFNCNEICLYTNGSSSDKYTRVEFSMLKEDISVDGIDQNLKVLESLSYMYLVDVKILLGSNEALFQQVINVRIAYDTDVDYKNFKTPEGMEMNSILRE